jgi:capsule polysaccharide export protein KpsE/RkpR
MILKSLWASVQGDPKFMRKLNGWLVIFWIAMIPISIIFGLLSSVVFVSALSLWALVSGHWSAWQAARVEVAQSEDANVQDVVDILTDGTEASAN